MWTKKNSPFLYILVMFTIGFMWSGIWLLWFISFHTWTKIVFCLTFLGVNKFHFFFQLYFSIFFSKFPFFSLYILLFEKNICNKIDFRSDIVSFPRHFTCFFVWFSPSLFEKGLYCFCNFISICFTTSGFYHVFLSDFYVILLKRPHQFRVNSLFVAIHFVIQCIIPHL